jgi:hypothetical protein
MPTVDILNLVKDSLLEEKKRKWLMVIDNADDVKDFYQTSGDLNPASVPSSSNTRQRKLGDYIPRCPHGSILINTRNKELAVKACLEVQGRINVLDMSDTECEDLIRNMLAKEDFDPDDTRLLMNTLRNLPLALAQSAAYISQSSISIK